MKRVIKEVTAMVFAVLMVGCGVTITPNAYTYSPGQPSYNERMQTWEVFGTPSQTNEERESNKNISAMETNAPVLWVIADSYGNSFDMDKRWFQKQSWFLDPSRLRFVQPANAPAAKQHWHGFACYSRGWPLLYKIPNVQTVLFRMIDVPNGEEALLDFLDEELPKYNGRVILSNSWGIPRQNSATEAAIEREWMGWANRLDKMAIDYPAFAAVFSSGNSGPSFSGVPQCILTNAIIVGATTQAGYIAQFSSQDNRIFCVAGGHRTYVADDQKSGEYMIVSGTSFSCPTVAAMLVKLLAENSSWGRKEAVEFLHSQLVPSPDSSGFNTVWGDGEIEQFNQTVPHSVWRELGYPQGFGARIRGWVAPTRLIDLPQPMPKNP